MSLEHELEAQRNSVNEYVQKRYRGLGLRYHQRVIEGLISDAHGRILDLGCGTGIIHELYPELKVHGLDISLDMLSHNQGTWTLGSAMEIPFPDRSFDYVVCRSLLHHLPDAKKGMSEIKRVLKPGGGFACWETNAGWLAEKVRHHTQHGDRFSEYHHSFNNLPELIEDYLIIREIKYEGFLAYPAFGFPDIIDFSRFTAPFFKPLIAIDEFLSHSPLKKMAFAIRIKAVK